MQITRIDHFVLTVASIEATSEFYQRVLGMEVVTFRGGRKALKFGQQKINLHEVGKEFSPRAHVAAPGTQDLCFIASIPLAQVMEKLAAAGVPLLEGPVMRTGATGRIRSVYVRDPDLNLVEISELA